MDGCISRNYIHMIEEYLFLLPGADVLKQFGKLIEIYITCISEKISFFNFWFVSKAPRVLV